MRQSRRRVASHDRFPLKTQTKTLSAFDISLGLVVPIIQSSYGTVLAITSNFQKVNDYDSCWSVAYRLYSKGGFVPEPCMSKAKRRVPWGFRPDRTADENISLKVGSKCWDEVDRVAGDISCRRIC